MTSHIQEQLHHDSSPPHLMSKAATHHCTVMTPEENSDMLSPFSEPVNDQATQTTFKSVLPENEPLRFEAFPPEIRNKIYGNLLSTEACKVEKIRKISSPRSPSRQLTYVFHTAILGTNRQVW